MHAIKSLEILCTYVNNNNNKNKHFICTQQYHSINYRIMHISKNKEEYRLPQHRGERKRAVILRWLIILFISIRYLTSTYTTHTAYTLLHTRQRKYGTTKKENINIRARQRKARNNYCHSFVAESFCFSLLFVCFALGWSG